MDPFGLFAAIVIGGLSQDIEKNKDDIAANQIEIIVMQTQIEDLSDQLLKLQSSHASVSARDKVNHDNQEELIQNLQRQIDNLKAKADYLDNKIGVLHP